jgi:hypothetical protein
MRVAPPVVLSAEQRERNSRDFREAEGLRLAWLRERRLSCWPLKASRTEGLPRPAV